MKNNLIFYLCLTLLFGCNTKKKEVVQDFSYLKIQTELSELDKAFYETTHKEINQIAKTLLFNEYPDIEKSCDFLKDMYKEISKRPISRERERERARARDILKGNCHSFDKELSTLLDYKFTCPQIHYLSLQIPSSGILHGMMKDCNPESNDKQKKQSNIIKNNYYQRLSQLVDPLDLEGYKTNLNKNLEKEYCQKSLNLKQWDHIGRLVSRGLPGGSLIKCLKKGDPGYLKCECPEAVKLYLKEAPRAKLLEGSKLRKPDSIDEGGYPNELAKKFIKDLKLVTGRDLDKEPKTEIIYEPCSY
jgi:hypothetical protein